VSASNADTESETDASVDTQTVTEHFASSPGMVKAHVVQNVKIFLAPESAIPARVIAHLPSHSKPADESESESDSDSVGGDAFETAQWRADAVSEAESLMVDADMESDAEVVSANADTADGLLEVQAESEEAVDTTNPNLSVIPSPSPTVTLPVSDLKQAFDQYNNLLPTPISLNPPVAKLAPTDLPTLTKAPKPMTSWEENNAEANALAASQRGPNGEIIPNLPGGFDIKPHIDPSPSTPANAKFPNRSLKLSKNCPGTKCRRSIPVMVGYVGHREQPAKSTREVRMPSDLDHYRQVHRDFKTGKNSWLQADLDRARKHLSRSARRIDKMRKVRETLEKARLNLKVHIK